MKSEENEVAVIEPTWLSVNVSNRALADLKMQRAMLKDYVKSQLIRDVDYGTVPGTQKDCLYKPGAEKLAILFKLGSRVIRQDKIIDHDNKFSMFTYAVEIFHLATGIAVAQCEGSINSSERGYVKRNYLEVINTLQKMAQKRAFVGAVIMAVGASDFFTQDLEDEKKANDDKAIEIKGSVKSQDEPVKSDGTCCNRRMMRDKFEPGKRFCLTCRKKEPI
jgi:hypothetical protein